MDQVFVPIWPLSSAQHFADHFTMQFSDITKSGDVELNPGPPVATATPPLSDDLMKSLKNGTYSSINLQHEVKNKHKLQLYALWEATPVTTLSSTEEWMRLILPSFPSSEASWANKLRLTWTELINKYKDLRKALDVQMGRGVWQNGKRKYTNFQKPRD